mgnify:CR=1 FL=1
MKILKKFQTTKTIDSDTLSKYKETVENMRVGERPNYDEKGNRIGESTVKLRAETLDGENWFVFPTLFQDKKPYADESKNWIDMSNQAESNWVPVYEEAKSRGEVLDFGKDKEAALKFAGGSWKK